MGNDHLRALFLHYFRFLSFRCYILIYSVLLLPQVLPNLRYLAGKDAEKSMEAKRGMSDAEFHEMMKQNMMK
jgi:hypothetical protein